MNLQKVGAWQEKQTLMQIKKGKVVIRSNSSYAVMSQRDANFPFEEDEDASILTSASKNFPLLLVCRPCNACKLDWHSIKQI